MVDELLDEQPRNPMRSKIETLNRFKLDLELLESSRLL